MRRGDPAWPDVVVQSADTAPGQIVITRTPGQVEISKAPRRARISLESLAAGCPHEICVREDLITLAEQVVYRVVGLDPLGSLVVELHEDRRHR